MYRIHKSGNNRCESPGQNGGVHESFQSFTSTVISSNLVYESASFEYPSCGKVFQSSKLLQEHIDHEHAEENSRTSLTLQSVADNSDWMYCQNPNLTTTQPQHNLNLVGFDTNITFHTHPPPTRNSNSTRKNGPRGLKFVMQHRTAILTRTQPNFNPTILFGQNFF